MYRTDLTGQVSETGTVSVHVSDMIVVCTPATVQLYSISPVQLPRAISKETCVHAARENVAWEENVHCQYVDMIVTPTTATEMNGRLV